jgi:hypothetical protein
MFLVAPFLQVFLPELCINHCSLPWSLHAVLELIIVMMFYVATINVKTKDLISEQRNLLILQTVRSLLKKLSQQEQCLWSCPWSIIVMQLCPASSVRIQRTSDYGPVSLWNYFLDLSSLCRSCLFSLFIRPRNEYCKIVA